MRRLSAIAFILICAVLGAACSAIDEFDHTMQDEATIPGTYDQTGPFALNYGGGFNSVSLSQEKSFQNAGVEPGDVDSIKVTSVRFEGKNPQIDRLDVLLESVTIWVEAPNLERKTIAMGANFPQNSTAVDLTVPDVELQPYAEAPSMKVGADVIIKQKPLFDTTLRTTIVLHVDIDVLGS
jgi:hypothetical protein